MTALYLLAFNIYTHVLLFAHDRMPFLYLSIWTYNLETLAFLAAALVCMCDYFRGRRRTCAFGRVRLPESEEAGRDTFPECETVAGKSDVNNQGRTQSFRSQSPDGSKHDYRPTTRSPGGDSNQGNAYDDDGYQDDGDDVTKENPPTPPRVKESDKNASNSSDLLSTMEDPGQDDTPSAPPPSAGDSDGCAAEAAASAPPNIVNDLAERLASLHQSRANPGHGDDDNVENDYNSNGVDENGDVKNLCNGASNAHDFDNLRDKNGNNHASSFDGEEAEDNDDDTGDQRKKGKTDGDARKTMPEPSFNNGNSQCRQGWATWKSSLATNDLKERPSPDVIVGDPGTRNCQEETIIEVISVNNSNTVGDDTVTTTAISEDHNKRGQDEIVASTTISGPRQMLQTLEGEDAEEQGVTLRAPRLAGAWATNYRQRLFPQLALIELTHPYTQLRNADATASGGGAHVNSRMEVINIEQEDTASQLQEDVVKNSKQQREVELEESSKFHHLQQQEQKQQQQQLQQQQQQQQLQQEQQQREQERGRIQAPIPFTKLSPKTVSKHVQTNLTIKFFIQGSTLRTAEDARQATNEFAVADSRQEQNRQLQETPGERSGQKPLQQQQQPLVQAGWSVVSGPEYNACPLFRDDTWVRKFQDGSAVDELKSADNAQDRSKLGCWWMRRKINPEESRKVPPRNQALVLCKEGQQEKAPEAKHSSSPNAESRHAFGRCGDAFPNPDPGSHTGRKQTRSEEKVDEVREESCLSRGSHRSGKNPRCDSPYIYTQTHYDCKALSDLTLSESETFPCRDDFCTAGGDGESKKFSFKKGAMDCSNNQFHFTPVFAGDYTSLLQRSDNAGDYTTLLQRSDNAATSVAPGRARQHAWQRVGSGPKARQAALSSAGSKPKASSITNDAASSSSSKEKERDDKDEALMRNVEDWIQQTQDAVPLSLSPDAGKCYQDDSLAFGRPVQGDYLDVECTLPWYIQVTWCLFSMVDVTSFLATLAYYGLTLRNEECQVFASLNEPVVDLNLHMVGTLLLLVDTLISARPVKLGDLVQCEVLTAIYLVFTLTYWALDPQHHVLYGVLDWGQMGVSTSVSMGTLFIFIPSIRLLYVLLFLMRSWLATVFCPFLSDRLA